MIIKFGHQFPISFGRSHWNQSHLTARTICTMESLSLDEFEYYVCYGYERPLPKFSSVKEMKDYTTREERKIMEDKIREEEREEDGKKRDKTLEDGAAKKDREGAAKKDKAVEAFTRAKRAFEEKGFSIAHKAFTEVSLCRFLPWRGHPYLETDH
ncbi:hypothetical protein AAHA92_28708 [Salvia divinorum]|uniref:Uncharacterized protein n=1 Tax=Salvia divinorum TaxID=28513 RepID=A0ABD1FVW5_SALDI